MTNHTLLHNHAVQASNTELTYQPVDPAKVIQGPATVGVAELATLGAFAIGVWEMSPSITTDIEVDECFVVLDGDATVSFDDGSAPLVLQAGTVGYLTAGTATTWTVRRTLRKVYLARTS